MADPRGIQDSQGAIPLGAPLLWIERAISRATQRSIWLQGKGRAGKATGKGRACPLGRAIRHRRCVFRNGWKLNGLGRLDDLGLGKFGGAHIRRGERHAQF